MTFYELMLFVHVVAAVIWVGAGFMMIVRAIEADRTNDEPGLRRVVDDNAWLATRLFIPSSLTVFVAGILLVVDGPWSFDQLWIVVGLAGYLATFATGLGMLKPRGDRIAAMVERDGGLTPESLADTRRLLALARIDYVVLFLVLADMTIKPTGDDVGLLVAMAAVLVAGVAWAVGRARAIEAPPQARPA